MLIGIPKEIKNGENRVAVTPEGVKKLVAAKHKVLVETTAGNSSGFDDNEYKKAGALVVSTEEVWKTNLIVKVKEPLFPEFQYIKETQIVFAYLHLAGADPDLTRELLRKRVIGIGYETVQKENELPLLKPMSEIAGKVAVQVGTEYLAAYKGGSGVLLDPVDDVDPGTVLIVGAGTVGQNAAHVALARGAQVIVLNRSKEKLTELQKWAKKNNIASKKLVTALSSETMIAKYITQTDILIGAVLSVSAKTPIVVPEELVKTMKKGSVIVDVAIDQGGCIATSRATSHKEPVFKKYDVTHYCVTNMPGAYPKTATIALTQATLPYILALANSGLERAMKMDAAIAAGVNTYKTYITKKPIATALEMDHKYKDLKELMR